MNQIFASGNQSQSTAFFVSAIDSHPPLKYQQ